MQDLTDRTVDDAALATYLRHHVAGSEAAERLARSLLGSDDMDPEAKEFLESFLSTLERERGFVTAALEQLDEGPGVVERGLGLASGLATKLTDALPSDAPMELEGLEALAVGVWGKRLLWGTLNTLVERDDRFRSLPLEELSNQADDQERELVRLRRRAIMLALTEAS